MTPATAGVAVRFIGHRFPAHEASSWGGTREMTGSTAPVTATERGLTMWELAGSLLPEMIGLAVTPAAIIACLLVLGSGRAKGANRPRGHRFGDIFERPAKSY